jgi:serine protease Do
LRLARAIVPLLALASVARAEDDPIAALERQQQALFDKIVPSVVLLSQGNTLGSGFFVDGRGLILTNRHVVGPAKQVKVVLSDGRTFTGKVTERATGDIDLALVRIPLEKTPALALEEKPDLRVGSWVASVGHGEGAIWSFNAGMVSNIYSNGQDRPVIQTQIPLNPGNSGGPVFDRRGRVVGIATAELKGSNAINFAIRTSVALRSLAGLAAGRPLLTILAPEGVPIFVDGKMAGTGPRLIVPAEPRVYEVFAVIGGVMSKQRVRFPETTTVDLKPGSED